MKNNHNRITDGLQSAFQRDPARDLGIEPGVVARHSPGSDGETALVFVLGIEPSTNTCDIALVHLEPKWATEHDIVVSSDETSLGYDFVVQTDIRASTYTQQITSVLTATPPEVLALARDPEPLASSERRGLRLKGRLDARWNFKVSEVHRLHRLVHLYIHDLLHDSTLDTFDNAERLASFSDEIFEALASADATNTQLLESFGQVLIERSPEITILSEQQSLLAELGLTDKRTWNEIAPSQGGALFVVLTRLPGFGGVRSTSRPPTHQWTISETQSELVLKA